MVHIPEVLVGMVHIPEVLVGMVHIVFVEKGILHVYRIIMSLTLHFTRCKEQTSSESWH